MLTKCHHRVNLLTLIYRLVIVSDSDVVWLLKDSCWQPLPVDEDEDNLDEIDLENIVEGGKRTRGRNIDFAKAAEESKDLDDDEDSEDDEDYEAPLEDEDMEQ